MAGLGGRQVDDCEKAVTPHEHCVAVVGIRALPPGRLRELGQIGMVLAAPPCQGFSNVGLHGEFAHSG